MALAGLVTQLVMNGVITHSRHKSARKKKEWGYLTVAAISGVIALSFLTAALYMALHALYTPPIAALLTGAVIGAGSLSCLYLAGRASDKEEAESWIQKELANENLAEKVDDLMSDIERPVKENPATALALATLAGFLTADRLH